MQGQGNTSHAFSILKRALAMAEPEDYVRTLIDKGLERVQLLSKLLLQIQKASLEKEQKALMFLSIIWTNSYKQQTSTSKLLSNARKSRDQPRKDRTP